MDEELSKTQRMSTLVRLQSGDASIGFTAHTSQFSPVHFSGHSLHSSPIQLFAHTSQLSPAQLFGQTSQLSPVQALAHWPHSEPVKFAGHAVSGGLLVSGVLGSQMHGSKPVPSALHTCAPGEPSVH